MKRLIVLFLIFAGVLGAVNVQDLKDQIKNQDPEIKMEALHKLSKYFLSTSQDSTLKYTSILILTAKENNNSSFHIKALATIGLAYEFAGDYANALKTYYDALEVSESFGEKIFIALSLDNLSITMQVLQNYPQSLEFALRALTIYEELQDEAGISLEINNLGNIYLYLSDYETSLSYYLQSLELKRDKNDPAEIALVYHNIALVYLKMENYNNSKTYFELSLKGMDTAKDLYSVATLYYNYTYLLSELELYDEAIIYSKKSIDFYKKGNLLPKLADSYSQMASIYLKQNNTDSARKYLTLAKEIIYKTNISSSLSELYELYSQYNKKIGDYEKSLFYCEKYQALTDSIQLQEQINRVTNLQISYDLENNNKELELLKEQQKIIKERNLYFLIISILLGGTLLITVLSNKRKRADIRLRIITEKNLRESEEKLRKFMDSATEIFNIYDPEMNLININEAGLKSYGNGITKEMLLGKNIRELIPNINTDGRLSTYKRILSSGKPAALFDVRTDGKFGEMYINIKAFRVGENLGMIISDISESKIAKKELQRSETKLLALFKAMDDIIIVFDRKGTYLDIAPTNQDKLIIPKEDLLGKKLLNVFGMDLGKKFMEKLEECFAWNHTTSIEYPLQIKDKSYWFDGRFSPMDNEKCMLIVRDITGYKRNEDIIKKSEERYKNLMETMQEGMALFNEKNILIYLNPKAEKTFGSDSSEILGCDIAEILLDSDHEKISTHNQYMTENKFYKYETTIKNKEAQERILKVSESPIYENGNYKGSFALFYDITEQRKNELAILESEAFNRAVISTSPLAITARDKFGTLILANESWKRMWNKTETDVEDAKRIRKNFQMDKRDSYLGDHLTDVQNIYLNGGELFIPQIEIPRLNKWISQHFYAIMTQHDPPNKQVDKVIVITDDITEQIIASNQLKTSLADKEILIKEVHHRVKNNLQIISSLLRMQSESINNPEVIEIFKDSLNRIRSLSLIHEKLYSSNNLEKINFASYINSLVSLINRSISYSTSKIKMKIDVKDIHMDINRAIPCGLIINELVSNAFKHGFKENQSGIIEVSFNIIDDLYTLVVANNGDPLPDSFTMENKGTLGVQLISALVIQLKGELELDRSTMTKFIIRFKRQKNEYKN